MQASDPCADSGLYFPATQSVHVPPSGPDEPALQVQFVTAELPSGDVALVGHVMHERADDSFEYLPAEQGMHVVDPGLELPEICNDSVEVSEICNHTSSQVQTANEYFTQTQRVSQLGGTWGG